MAQQRLSYSNLNSLTLPPKPQLNHANKSTSHLEINYHNTKNHKYISTNYQQSKPPLNAPTSTRMKGIKPSLQLNGYPSADSSSSAHSNGSRRQSPTHNNGNPEKKVVYKFKSGEQFVSFPYLTPQKIIGEGSYACVASAMDTRTKKKYAIKKNRNAFVNIGDAKRILREIKLMYHFRGHPNLMSVIDVIPPDVGTQQKFNDVYLIMPKMHMTLSKLIMKSSIGKIALYEIDIQTIMYQICRGLEYMHSGGVIHRDLKPDNILINCYFHSCNDAKCNIVNKNLWQVRITDFGLARGVHNNNNDVNHNIFLDDTPNNNNNKVLTEYVVTRYYRAPEVMCCSRLYDSQIDVWSLGCIFGEMYYKKALFRGNNHLHQLQVIFFYCGTPYDLSWVKMKDAKQWICQLPKHDKKDLQKEFSFYNYCNSNSADNSIRNAAVGDDKCGIMSDNATDLLHKLLIIDPNKRWNISNTLKHSFFANLYKEKDYERCVPFDTTFEQEPILRTNFGVRHMMYEELRKIHKHCKNNLAPKR